MLSARSNERFDELYWIRPTFDLRVATSRDQLEVSFQYRTNPRAGSLLVHCVSSVHLPMQPVASPPNPPPYGHTTARRAAWDGISRAFRQHGGIGRVSARPAKRADRV